MSYKDYELNSIYDKDRCKIEKCIIENYDCKMEEYQMKPSMEKCKVKPMSASTIEDHDKCKQNLDGVTNDYAKAFIVPQVYENIFAMNDALCKGTIFKDLYKPYKEHQKCYY